ncbi:MAG TPA: glutaredoxin domain-containing protein [Bdellovibrionota bacterium]|jgi:glutaredoxin 3
MKSVVVYTTTHCGYCIRAKELLKQRNIPFEEVFVSRADDDAWAELHRKSGMRTMPQVFIGDECIGGYRELAALDQNGELLRKVKS